VQVSSVALKKTWGDLDRGKMAQKCLQTFLPFKAILEIF